MEIKDKNLYYVGGVVRDEILGAANFDIDFCYEGNAIEFSKNLNVIKTNPDFGTVRVLYEGKEIDLASTRVEIYPKAGHLPKVSNIGCSLKEDLKRRDFTINAMAKNTLTGEIVDYFGGLDDIKNKKLRILHDKSFIDDPTRILRGLKFAVRFGFELEVETRKLQDEYLKNINYDMSYHRLKKELKETFNLNKEVAYKRFIEQDIYRLLGEKQTILEPKASIEELISKFNPISPWIVYLGLFDLSKLELTKNEREIIESIDSKDYKNMPVESILLQVLKTGDTKGLDYLRHPVKVKITGEDLKKLGIKEGKVYKEIFDYVFEEKIKKPDLDEIELVKRKFV